MNKYVKYINDLEKVRKRITETKNEFDIKGRILNGDDIRYSILNQLYRLIMSYNFGLVDFLTSTYGENKVKELFKVEDAFETSEILLDYFRFLKNGFIYQLNTLVENYYRTIHRSVFRNENNQKEFYNIRDEVFTYLNVDKESNRWKSLSILSNIRNCIHNNGIYISKRKNITIEYYDRKHEFIHGEAQNSSDPETIILILNDCLTTIIEINSQVEYAKDISHRRKHEY